MEYVIDFDKMFEEYAMEWFAERKDEYPSDEDVESAMSDVYEQWASSPSHKLGGIAPRAFFDGIENPSELVGILVGTSEGDNNPCSLLLDRIAEVKECAPLLCELLEKPSTSDKLCLICIELLYESGECCPVETYVSFLNGERGDGVKERIVDVLEEFVESAKPALYKAIDGAPAAVKSVIAEILSVGEKDERTFRLLTELFVSGENTAFYSQLLGRYGDERAASVLYRALETADYASYIEIRNAIECLGGTVDDELDRDFSDDLTFITLKGKE